MRIEEKVNQIVDCCIIDTMDLNIEHLSYVFGVHILYNHESNFYVRKSRKKKTGEIGMKRAGRITKG